MPLAAVFTIYWPHSSSVLVANKVVSTFLFQH